MRYAMLMAVALSACAPKEQASSDTTAAATGLAPLTAEMVAGTWNGTSMAETSDSVTLRWTTVSLSGSEGGLIREGTQDTIRFTRSFDADSMIATSVPYPASAEKGAPMITFRSIARMVNGKLVGTSTTNLADKPDSVVQRGRFEAAKAP